jgi:Xaa-Pro dipeptidase
MTASKKAAPPPIGQTERKARINALCAEMQSANIAATLVGPTSSLIYFTGMSWYPSERLTAALVHVSGKVEYITPGFEREKVAGIIGVPGDIHTWEEDESPYRLVADRLPRGKLAIDDQVALFFFLGLRRALTEERLADAGPLINKLRRQKSPAELALMTHAKAITLEVHRRAWKSLKAGVRASEVEQLIDREHRALGGTGNTFCIVSFAQDTALPHGGEEDRALAEGDLVLIDTGTRVHGYCSDITRTYAFGETTKKIRDVWRHEKEAQAAAFEAAHLGAPCESVDHAARAVLQRAGYGPDYRLPGLPHRTGHGIGLDVHESPNLVRGDKTALAPGMCFSNEPMIVIPGEFGIRLEDHFYVTDKGARWFTEPQASLEDPFANVPAFA